MFKAWKRGQPSPAIRCKNHSNTSLPRQQRKCFRYTENHKNNTLPLFPIQDLPISLIMEEAKDAHSNSHVFLVILFSIMDTTQSLGHYPVDVGLNGRTTSLFCRSLPLRIYTEFHQNLYSIYKKYITLKRISGPLEYIQTVSIEHSSPYWRKGYSRINISLQRTDRRYVTNISWQAISFSSWYYNMLYCIINEVYN